MVKNILLLVLGGGIVFIGLVVYGLNNTQVMTQSPFETPAFNQLNEKQKKEITILCVSTATQAEAIMEARQKGLSREMAKKGAFYPDTTLVDMIISETWTVEIYKTTDEQKQVIDSYYTDFLNACVETRTNLYLTNQL